MHVEVAAGNQSLCRGNMVSSGFARPFDRMPVEVTHKEGVTPTEVGRSPTSLRLRPCLDVWYTSLSVHLHRYVDKASLLYITANLDGLR